MKKDIESKKKSNNVFIFPYKRQNFDENSYENYKITNYEKPLIRSIVTLTRKQKL